MGHSGITVAALSVYPIKSAGGILLSRAEVQARGLRDDRRWMLVDAEGLFLSQRTCPQMALLQVSLQESSICVQAPGMPPCDISREPESTAPVEVRVWRSTCAALPVATAVDEWFSTYLKRDCRLVWMAEDEKRKVNPDFEVADGIVSFADGYPCLLTTTASLDDLNERMGQRLPMNRFRPNLVLDGTTAFAEDRWKEIKIGEVSFAVVKPCERCVVTTTNQNTAERGKEPLKTLSTFRKHEGGVFFGQNLIPRTNGQIEVGMPVQILEEYDTPRPPLNPHF